MERKRIYLIITLCLVTGLVLGTTRAIYNWSSSDNTDVAIAIEGLDAYINYQKGTDVLTGTLIPGSDYKTGISTEIELWKSPKLTMDVFATIYLDITTIGENMKNAPALKWAIESNNVLLAEGNFLGQEEGNSITLKDGIKLQSTKQTYVIYIWLDEKMNISQGITGETLSTKVRATAINLYYKDPSGANTPELMSGMVPVEYLTTSDGVETDGWYVADQKTDWYNYSEQRWANAVLVTEESGLRTASAGTIVPEDSVLAYYVWIPRYKYKLFNAEKTIGVDSYDAQNTGINVVFESGTSTTGTVSCSISLTGVETCTNAVNGNYYTHPAFWWDVNDNGVRETSEELSGIWVGKFEISSETPVAEYGGGSSTALSVRIKPNVYSWRSNNISNFFTVIQNMMKDGNEYGISDEETDSHMLKNMEWGAVAYLTQSLYGRCQNNICTEIEVNANNSGVVGGANYITNVGQSTTNNVTGIYDMSGGTHEYVMGNMISPDGITMMSGYSDSLNSGFNGIIYNLREFTNKTDGVVYPSKRYYDIYLYGITNDDQEAYTRGHLGDATGEVVVDKEYSWYNDFAYFAYAGSPWFARGGNFGGNDYSGIFVFYWSVGIESSNIRHTTRSVLVVAS